MTIKQRKRRQSRRRAHAGGVSRAIGRPQPPRWSAARMDIELAALATDTLAVHAAAEVTAEREAALNLLTVAKLHALATRRGVEYRAKDRKAELIAKIAAGPS